ncbi:MAG TPA: GtrA family protein [Dehalococcoidia bacterium]
METTASADPSSSSSVDRLAARLHVSPEFLRFLLVGGIAFVLNQAALLLLYDVLPVLPARDREFDFGLFTHPDIRLLLASGLAVQAAIVLKFYALENWTFRDRPRHGWGLARFLQFNASCIVSPLIVVTTVNVLTPVFGISPYLSTTAGTVFGFLANWAFSAYLIWPLARSEASAA